MMSLKKMNENLSSQIHESRKDCPHSSSPDMSVTRIQTNMSWT